jgi:hypothetical protein
MLLHVKPLGVALAAMSVLGCGPDSLRDPGAAGEGGYDDDPSDHGGGGGPADDPSQRGGGGFEAVFAHGYDALYRVDPDSLAIQPVGAFGWPAEPDTMTDIAVDSAGRIVGISFSVVYEVDPATARCRRLAALDRELNGLSFVQGDDGEVLLGAALDGTVVRLDPQSGASTTLGSFGDGLTSSGDLVSVDGFGTVATARTVDGWTDVLVSVDPSDGSATIIGDTGVTDIWGLGFWRNRVFGFTGYNELVVIDPESGAATVEGTGDVPWYGAGVTTAAPLI